MAEIETYFIDNDNMIQISGVRDAANGIYLNNADFEVTLVDAATETEIVGQTWPATMSYVHESDGIYRLTLEYDLEVVDQQNLIAKLSGNPFGLRLSLRIPVIARYRQGE